MKKMGDKVPDCSKCRPATLDENLPVMYLLERYVGVIITEYGLSAEGISLALNEPWIKDSEKSNYADKLVVYLNALRSAVNKNKI